MSIAIFILIIIVIIIIIYNINQEYFTNTSTANEALQTISSVFNNQNMTLSNLTATGTITANNSIISSGSNAGLIFNDRSGSPQWSWYGNGTANLWNGSGNAVTIDKSGNINTNGTINANNLNITGTLTIGGVPITASNGTVTIGGNIYLHNNTITIKQDNDNAAYIYFPGPTKWIPNINVTGGNPNFYGTLQNNNCIPVMRC